MSDEKEAAAARARDARLAERAARERLERAETLAARARAEWTDARMKAWAAEAEAEAARA